ncbi:dTDP-4-dehydrorhamnose 3,5-epimerase family protein [Adhaeribacter rhizoryzae]|uniref:dTDP-4-dehydrorhamnose 3,5-epimerase n=1 Tax=Adhaeribacter rhizoryzae TaxID=2607907 RepID=A0A5M6DML6_9BACT|nr:dTDP-4-dehydrorhamnose 3,5-epimerase family protein [Adhaeribacter rhizoryzae]KAA5548787.1 dTDP-4-keto-6-deoxy-D-glucose epimerase [Adhaeribacter rhizoryzae]
MKKLDLFPGGAFLFESHYFEDERGVFLKVFNTDNSFLSDYTVKQINYVTSAEKHTLRGLHFQHGDNAESKVFRVINGAAQVAFVDVRPDSPTYLQASTVVLDNPKRAVAIPRGFATGYLTLTNNTVMLYLADNDYNVSTEGGLLWNDPALNINWLEKNPILSDKDKAWALVTK